MEQPVISHEQRKATQQAKVLAWLKEVGSITPRDAYRLGFGMRLAAHIHVLRKRFVIRTDIEHGKDGARWAKYTYVNEREALKTIELDVNQTNLFEDGK